jgi:hypothetical protein
VSPEVSVSEHRINDAGHLLRAADPHADAGYVVALPSRMGGCRDDIALQGERYRQISVEQGHAAGPMRDDDHPEGPCRHWRILGHRHLERYTPTDDRRQATQRERASHEERRGRRGGGIPESDRE